MTPTHTLASCFRRAPRQGFTLMEVLAALAVVSVAATFIITLFVSSMTLSQTRRSRRVAAGLAQEQLELLARQPDLFAWPALDQPGAFEPVTAKSGEAGFALPTVMPSNEREARREAAFHERFFWQAHARLATPDADYVEVTVAVGWNPQRAQSSVALTTALPRARAGEASP